MRTRSKLLHILLSLVLAVSMCPVPAFADDASLTAAGGSLMTQAAVSMTQSEYNSKSGAFVNDGRWRNGVPFSNKQGPKLSNYSSGGCFAYACDFTKYMYGIDSIRNGSPFSNRYDIRQGDVIQVNSGGHTIVVLGRNGNSLYTAEGNWTRPSGGVRVANGAYTVSGLNFYTGWHYVDIKPDDPNPTPPLSGQPRVSVAAGSYMVRSKIGFRSLDVEYGSHDNEANVQIYQPLDNTSQIFNIGYYATLDANYIQLKESGKYVDAKGGNGATNVWQFEGNGGKGQNWVFEDAGDGYVYIRNVYGYYLDVSGGENRNGANVQTFEYNGSDAQKWKLMPVSGELKQIVPDGQYVIRSKVGNKVLDIDSAKQENRANAQIYQPLGNASQIFNIGYHEGLDANYIQLKASGKFIDAAGGDGAVNVWQFEENGDYAQNWFFEDAGDGYYYIRNLYGFYLDVYYGIDANGSNVGTRYFDGSDAVKWKILPVSGVTRTRVSDGAYVVKSKVGNRALDVDSAKSENEANVQIYKSLGNDSQVFKIEWDQGIEASRIQLKASGKLVDTAGGDGVANVWQFSDNGGNGQRWFFEDAGDGYFFIRNLYGYYLDVKDAENRNGANVWAYTFNGLDNQKWKIERVGSSSAKTKSSKWSVKTKDYRFTIPKYWRGKVAWKTTSSDWQGLSGSWHTSYRTSVYLKGHKGDDRYLLATVESGSLTGVGSGHDILVSKRTEEQDSVVNESVWVMAVNWPYMVWDKAYRAHLGIPKKAQKKLVKLATGGKVSYKQAKKGANYNTKRYKAVSKFQKPRFKKSLKVYV